MKFKSSKRWSPKISYGIKRLGRMVSIRKVTFLFQISKSFPNPKIKRNMSTPRLSSKGICLHSNILAKKNLNINIKMLGCIVSGRLVQTDFQQIEQTKWLINIPEADSINYVVVFLTGQIILPEGTAAGVYWSWPDPNSPPSWQFLGYISNNKPSAIFKISQLKKLHEMESRMMEMNIFGTQAISHIAQIGVSIEPENSIVQQTPATSTNPSTYFEFGKKMLENFVNFASSYTVTLNQAQMLPNQNETYVPLNSLTTWFNNFQRRLEQNPNFWK